MDKDQPGIQGKHLSCILDFMPAGTSQKEQDGYDLIGAGIRQKTLRVTHILRGRHACKLILETDCHTPLSLSLSCNICEVDVSQTQSRPGQMTQRLLSVALAQQEEGTGSACVACQT